MSAADARWQRVNELFHAAVAVASADRDGFLSTQCGADRALRAEVESLLAMHRPGDDQIAPALRPGSRFGDYEITGFIASGGMGDVYRARDTRLGRDAALKVLPTTVVADPDRRARFEREARTLASLTHPHIATIYGVEEADGVNALALELVDGETLADRIARSRLPVDEALRIARQIAAALETAHDHGIVHRDLKPANVKITRDGVVKVLDFGLAKLADSADGGSFQARSAVATLPDVTGAGTIVGTPAYMSPEQARGELADQRTDIWAFGCVLYEMLTGQPAFGANTVADTIARVLASEPKMEALPKHAPETIRTLIVRCLAKDRVQRIPHASVIRYLLDESNAPKRDESWPAWTLKLLQDRNSRAVVIVALVLLIPAIRGAVRAIFTTPPAAPHPLVTRFEIALPPEQSIWPTNDGMNIAISPDGARIAYVGSATVAGESQLVIRRLDELRGIPVPDTEGARNPFFSPDGQWVAFFAGNEIRKMSVAGGATITICRIVPLSENRDASGTWTPDDIIYFSRDRDDGDGLKAVPASGGEPKPVVGAFENLERGLGWPSALPRRRALLLAVKGAEGGGTLDLLDLGSGRRKTLLRAAQWAQYVEGGYLVYVSNQTLQAVRFDLERSAVIGSPVTPLPGVSIAGFEISKTGTLAYVAGRPTGTNAGIRTLVWVDRNGQETPTGAPPRSYGSFRLAPDSERVAVDIRGAQPGSIWIWDFTRQTLTRLDTASENAINPVWTRDGQHIAFNAARQNFPVVLLERADGIGPIESLSNANYVQTTKATTPDGLSILASSGTGQIDLVTLQKPAASRPILKVSSATNNPDVSSDGHWLAYDSDESGTRDVYVRPFANVDGGRWQVSTSGGRQPVWARKGKELFFLDHDGFLTAVSVGPQPVFTSGPPRRLLTRQYSAPGGNRAYDVSADGQRFLMMKDVEGEGDRPANIAVVLNWIEELKRLLPVDN